MALPEPKKTLYTLMLNPEVYKDVTDLTYPFLKHYARKCGAEFVEITERKFPDWPANYEKFQVYRLAQERGDDWSIFFDADALINPNTPDFTEHLPKDTVAHNGADMSTFRFKKDRFYRRDGRNIGSATWCCICSDWCIDMMEPPPDITPAEVEQAIFPTSEELKRGVSPIRLVEDFLIGRNIAKYGLKFKMIKDLMKDLKVPQAQMFFHIYACPPEEKVVKMCQLLMAWGFEEVAVKKLEDMGARNMIPKQFVGIVDTQPTTMEMQNVQGCV